MPWDELVPRPLPALERELEGNSRKTMEDHEQAEGNQASSQLRALPLDDTFALLGTAIDVHEHTDVPDFGAKHGAGRLAPKG